MNTTNCCVEPVQEFPDAAKKFLQAFYEARQIPYGNTRDKISALREGYFLKDAIISADGAVSDDEAELRILEFYVLTKRGIL